MYIDVSTYLTKQVSSIRGPCEEKMFELFELKQDFLQLFFRHTPPVDNLK